MRETMSAEEGKSSITKKKKVIPKRASIARKANDSPGEQEEPTCPVKGSGAREIDSTFILTNVNITKLDKTYILPEIAKKQERERTDEHPSPKMRSRKSIGKLVEHEDDIKVVTTSLERLGIATSRKEPMETIAWSDNYKIKLFVSKGTGVDYELTPAHRLRCTWCHQYPPEGALMLAVPYRYVPSFVHEQVYAPECVNIIKSINVDPVSKSNKGKEEEKKKGEVKSTPKINYFKRDITSRDQAALTGSRRLVVNDYFQCSKPVCSFDCMEAKGRELALVDARYKNVRMLITQLYWHIFDRLPEKITPAPPCDILLEYGGEHSLDEYRRDFKFITLETGRQYYSKAKALMTAGTQLFVAASAE